MIYYVIFCILLLCSSLNIKKEFIKKGISVFLCIFLCFSYFNGSDWRNYERIYEQYSLKNFYNYPFEKIFSLYFSVFKILNIDFWNFFIITKVFCFCIFLKVMRFLSFNFFLEKLIFFIQMGLYLFIDCPLRNLIAISFSILAILFYLQKKTMRALIFVFFGLLFHNSAIILLFIYFLCLLMRNSKKEKEILIFLFFLSFLFSSKDFVLILVGLFKIIPSLYLRVINYVGSSYDSSQLINIRLFEKYIVTLFTLMYYEKIKIKYKYGKEVVILNLIFLILYRIGNTFSVLTRFQLYFRIFDVIAISYLFGIIKEKYTRFFLKSVYLCYLFLNLYILIHMSTLYLPYTNYLQYIFKDKPSYEYRINFNKNYRKEIKN